jgi:hypothetical protein
MRLHWLWKMATVPVQPLEAEDEQEKRQIRPEITQLRVTGPRAAYIFGLRSKKKIDMPRIPSYRSAEGKRRCEYAMAQGVCGRIDLAGAAGYLRGVLVQ